MSAVILSEQAIAQLDCRFQEIMGHLERQYDDVLAEESRIKRNPRFRDDRVHCLLYFIPPTGHSCVYCFHETRQMLRFVFTA